MLSITLLALDDAVRESRAGRRSRPHQSSSIGPEMRP
jgi:hypothetical protein